MYKRVQNVNVRNHEDANLAIQIFVWWVTTPKPMAMLQRIVNEDKWNMNYDMWRPTYLALEQFRL